MGWPINDLSNVKPTLVCVPFPIFSDLIEAWAGFVPELKSKAVTCYDIKRTSTNQLKTLKGYTRLPVVSDNRRSQ